jgi:hypothetical protein
VAACRGGGGGGGGGGPSSGSLSTAPATPASTVTTRVPAPTTTTAVPIAPQRTPDAAATALLAAWSHGDRVGARRVASAGAVATLFAQPVGPFSDRGCQDPQAGNSSCAFGLSGGLVQIQTVSLAGGWVVGSVAVNP